MQVKVLKEAGVPEALLGLSLSYYDGGCPLESWWDQNKKDKAMRRANGLAHRQGGHNKFLESVMIWMHVRASRGWWQEFDTYRVGVTKNSASTMHTLAKRLATKEDFVEGTTLEAIEAFNTVLKENPKDITRVKANLPEGFLQDRVICLNYKALQGVIYQRAGHRLTYWGEFIRQTLSQVSMPDWLVSQDAS